ncbi:hypothetical protein ACQQ2N_03120 [Dokdonella sp. MW10]|uniref:hypothetical protein n=1 Tax=Dokdonella sp. MW10 TaxID=2992926 RepID=UPI003F80FCCB
MPRATIVVAVDEPGEIEAAERWLARWSTAITYQSDNQGCGCCVDIWEVEASAEAMAELPEFLAGPSPSHGDDR